jgi:hypothetical protein
VLIIQGLPEAGEMGVTRIAAAGNAAVGPIAFFESTDGVNGLAKGIASSKELFGTPCAAALNPTRATLPISISTCRIAPISQTRRPLDSSS